MLSNPGRTRPLLTPSRLETETAVNERERTGTGRNQKQFRLNLPGRSSGSIPGSSTN